MVNTMRYVAQYPLKSLPILYQRLRFSILKRDVSRPVLTPEGLVLKSAKEIISYGAIFIEQTLFNPLWMKALGQEKRPTVIDVGCNIGMTCLLFRKLNRNANIIALDPLPLHAKRAKENNPDCLVLNAGASDKAGSLTFYVGNYLCTFNKQIAGEIIREQEVEIVRVDSLTDQNVFLLKIDTDGHNQQVLEGCTGILQRTRFIIVEREAGVDEFFSKHPEFILYHQTDGDSFYEQKRGSE